MSKEKEAKICEVCGNEIYGEAIEFDGRTLCEECFNSETVICEHCGERIWRENNVGTRDFPLCSCCYDAHYTSCERCGRIIHEDDANYIDDEAYCDSCYECENGRVIRDYSYKPTPIFYGKGKRFFGVELLCRWCIVERTVYD